MSLLTAGPNDWPWACGLLGLVVLAIAGLRTASFLKYKKRRRSKKAQHLDSLTKLLYLVAGVLLLVGLAAAVIPGAPNPTEPNPTDNTSDTSSGKPTEPSNPSEPTETESQLGWKEDGGGRFYLLEDGTRATGWMDMEGRRYYFTEDGYTLSGWQDLEGINRYFREDGSMARGEVEIDGVRRFFTSTGAEIIVANPWNYLPEGYEVELRGLSVVYATDGVEVAASIYDPLIEMMDDCNAKSGSRCCVVSGFRTEEYQTASYESLVRDLMNDGKSEADARAEAATRIAIPGTSEHQLGLAVDIIDTQLWSLDRRQENLEAQQWLMAHSWEYGFLFRYPDNKIDVTGIIYEPWHYRYVGKDLAKELKELDVTLEEYLAALD